MTREEIDKFAKVESQVEGIHAEIGLLSRKSPNDGVSKFKLKFVNEILKEANTVLTDNYVPFEGFEVFDEDDIPTNSDVTMMFEQYLKCLEKLRSDNIKQEFGYWYWIIDGELSERRTKSPSRVKEKK